MSLLDSGRLGLSLEHVAMNVDVFSYVFFEETGSHVQHAGVSGGSRRRGSLQTGEQPVHILVLHD